MVATPAATSAANAAKATAQAAKPAKPKEPEPEPLPPPEVRIWLVAPSPSGPWVLRIDNEGAKPVRVPADVRLLELEIDVPVLDDAASAAAAAAAKKPAVKKKPPKPVTCKAPDAMRPSSFPESRALLLGPGESYIEQFDPLLLCFGKSAAALTGGAVVRSRFGWAPPKVPSWVKKKPTPTGPFAVEGTDYPAVLAPLSQISAPTIVLSYGHALEAEPGAQPGESKEPEAQAKAAGPAPAPRKRRAIVDTNAPRLEVKAQDFADAGAPRSISLTTTAKNAGHRPMLAVLRPRMLGYHVAGPDGESICMAAPPTHAIPRDMYRSYKPAESTSFTVLLAEVCPQDTFTRPGLYRVTPTLYALETGSELGLTAYTSVAPSENASLLRLQTGPDPFYDSEPRAIPTPRPILPPDAESAEGAE